MISVQVIFTRSSLRVEKYKEGRTIVNSIFVFSLGQKTIFRIDLEAKLSLPPEIDSSRHNDNTLTVVVVHLLVYLFCFK